MKYNYVIFWENSDYYDMIMQEIRQLEQVRYIPGLLYDKPKYIRLLHKLHNSTKINSKVRLPLKSLWHHTYFKNDFANHRPFCFLFYGSYYWMKGNGYFSYLREQYADCKLVMMYMDTIKRYSGYFSARLKEAYDVEYIKKTFDLVLTYNLSEARKYGLIYYPSIYCNVSLDRHSIQGIPESDVFFIGRSKDRLTLLRDIYCYLTDHGLRCEFYISGVDRKDMDADLNIHYNQCLSYRQVLDCVAKTNCILEVIQQDTIGFTLRTDEALCFNKKILTNNEVLKHTKYYDDDYVIYFDRLEEIDINKIKHKTEVNYGYEGEYSSLKFLEFVDSKW